MSKQMLIETQAQLNSETQYVLELFEEPTHYKTKQVTIYKMWNDHLQHRRI